MKDWIMVLKAADAAARWHVHQRRKGAAKEPYINHLLEVASLVAEATEGKDPNLVIAALLHDAIEDCEVPRKLIAESFGTDVAESARSAKWRALTRKPSARSCSSSPTKPAICERSFPAQRQTGQCGADQNTSIGLAKSLMACGEQTLLSRSSLMRLHELRRSLSDQHYRLPIWVRCSDNVQNLSHFRD
jgi:hypothetical protein